MHHYPGIATEGAKGKERRKRERGVETQTKRSDRRARITVSTGSEK